MRSAAQGSHRTSIGLLIAGLGLVISGVAIWWLLLDVKAGYAGGASDFSAIPAPVSFPAPSLRLRDLHGTEHSLADQLGDVILVNLWATWCPPCAAEMPNYERFFQKYKARGFTVVAVNDGESADQVAAFVSEHNLTFPVWLDPKYEATERAFKTANLPTSYVIDRGGMVRLMWIGAISQTNLEKYVSPLIKE